jgi:hypothetical protein
MHDHPLLRAGFYLPFLFAMASLALGQAPAPARVAANVAVAPSCGLHVVDGALWAGGPRFKVEFQPDGVEFTPALGSAAPHNLPLAVHLATFGRGADLRPVSTATLRHEGLRATYHRAELCERYDVSAAGLAQSFVFEHLPPGTGDLVLRMRAETELPLAAANADGLRFELPGIGGVQVGAVTGIDARGERCPGQITYDGVCIELRLPAAFVDHATLPLVVDPTFGPVLPISSGTADYQQPHMVANDGLWLCVFELRLSASDRDIRAQGLINDGALFNGLIMVTTASTDEHAPAAGFVAQHGYVVVWERSGDLFARKVTSNSGGVSLGPSIGIATGLDQQVAADVGSERTSTDNDAICVFHNATDETIEAVQIQVNTDDTLTPFAAVNLTPIVPLGQTVGPPRISQDGGADGRYFIVYPSTILGGDTNPRGIVVDRNLGTLAGGTISASSFDDDNADVDGNGTEWIVAYESETTEGSSNNDIRAVPVFYDVATTQLIVGSPVVVANTSNDEARPAVGSFGTVCGVAWRRRVAPGSTDTDVYIKTLDQFACAQCEPTLLLAGTTATEHNVTIATGAARGLIVWEAANIFGGTGEIRGIVFREPDSDTSGSSGCGEGGRTASACPHVGNANFHIRLREARVATMAWLVVSAGEVAITCGGCTLRADPFHGFVASGITTDAHGNAELSVPLPNSSALANVTFHAQWIVATPSGLCSYLATDFSSRQTIPVY